MKVAKKRMEKVVEAPIKPKVGQVGKSTNRTRGRCPKPAELLVDKGKHSSTSGSTEALSPRILDKGKCSVETIKGLPISEQYLEQTPHPSTKLKLQLFPLDEVTRMGLEKDGYHPYLELTLSVRKKMSSVLKHLNCKWGGSSVAIGEPILFPFTLSTDLASCKWTVNDGNLCAGDVYVAIGSPSIFRLRYGWFSDCINNSSAPHSASTPLRACLQSESLQKDCHSNTESIHGKGGKIEVTSEELKPTIVSGATDLSVAEKISSSRPVELMCNERKMLGDIGQSAYLWDDSLTNISIGGLLSEASLLGKFNNGDPKSDGSHAGLQPSQLISDSFDAFIMSQVNHAQAPKLHSHVSSSSILDAEDTCHAFPFQKFSSLGKEALALGESAYSRACSQDAVSKSFKYPNISEVNIQSGTPQGHGCQESETNLSLGSRIYNDESSLGLSGIKWESLGPFDLGLSSSRKIIGSDSLSFSRIIS